MAQAVDSSGIEYRDVTPSPTGEIPTKETPATTSKQKGGAENKGDSGNTGKSEGDSEEEANSGGVKGGSDEGTGQGNPGTGESNPGAAAKAGKLALARSLGNEPSGGSDSGGGSSPLVPILIAIAAVMAVAIAVVVIRQRRQRGGPDGHVSPEAS